MPLRQTVSDTFMRTGHMSADELAQTCPTLRAADRLMIADLLVHMAHVEDTVTSHIHQQLEVLESLGYTALGDDDDNVDYLHEHYSLSADSSGKPEEIPLDSWKYVMYSERPPGTGTMGQIPTRTPTIHC